VKNVGTCAWSKDYKIFFFGGNQMHAPSAVSFPQTVNPGETVNLSVNMVAPSDKGSYSGSWMLKSSGGTVFGVGAAYNVPLTVNIKVEKSPQPRILTPCTTWSKPIATPHGAQTPGLFPARA